ncbi:MAG: hypothetical protein HOP32_16410 [Nitrospira sp.]|nr:hypothetical protein [Nitrospira sp.]
MTAILPVAPVCLEQVDPLDLYKHLKWIDGRPLLDVMEPYRRVILRQGLYSFRPDGSPLYRRVLTGRGKKNSKTTDAVLAALYKCLVWKSAGQQDNQCYYVASDLAQANDDLELTKLLIRRNPVLSAELVMRSNIVERRDGKGFIEILPARDAQGLHGKTYLFLVVDELHTQRTYDLLTALEIDRTRPDAQQWFASYASLYRHAGVPLVDIQKQAEAKTDPRLYVSWYAGSIAEANPSLNGPLGPTLEDVEDAQRSLPSWIFRRLYQNEPGQPDCAAFDFDSVEACIVKGRKVLPPQAGRNRKAFVDFGAGGDDDSVLGIAEPDEQGRAVLVLLVNQGPRSGKTYSPADTAEKFCDILDLHGCPEVTGDNFAKNWPQDAFRRRGIRYVVSDKNRSEIYAAFEPMLNAGMVELLDLPILTRQLIGLIRKGVKIDHPAGEHDDWSNAAAGACVLAAASPQQASTFRLTGW